jgi:hypothetical protein
MSLGNAKLISKKGSQMTETNKVDTDLRICVFCYTTTYAYICPECRDYKGLMPVIEAEEYLGEDLEEYL